VTPLVLLAASWLLAQPVSAPAPPRGTIAVTVSGVRHTRGSLRVKLVGSGEGFPGSDAHVVAKRRVAADGPGARFAFESVPYGEYAVVCLHDADDDAELDRGPLGLPAEGLGFSSGARVRFGPPDFEEARFVLGTPEISIGIELRYGWEQEESR
jgi:uncharacterized protein (DUF2141 family)